MSKNSLERVGEGEGEEWFKELFCEKETQFLYLVSDMQVILQT